MTSQQHLEIDLIDIRPLLAMIDVGANVQTEETE